MNAQRRKPSAVRIRRGDVTELSGFDENAYAPEGQFCLRDLEGLVSEFTLQRASTLALVNGIPPAAWPRVGTANGFRTSARALVYRGLADRIHRVWLSLPRVVTFREWASTDGVGMSLSPGKAITLHAMCTFIATAS